MSTLASQQMINTLSSQWQSASHLIGSLIEFSSELFSQGNDEARALSMLDAAYLLIRTPSNESRAVCLEQLLHFSSEQKTSACGRNIDSAPDMYQEDECDVGPRVLQTPSRVAAATYQSNDLVLLESFVVFNKALIHHSTGNHEEAKQLYQHIVNTVQNALQLMVIRPSNKLLELGMRAHNNVGQVYYLQGDEEMSRGHFEASMLFATQLSDLSRDYRLEYANVLSNWCRVNTMRGDISDNLYKGLKEVLRLRSSILPWDHADVAAAHYNVGVAEYARQRSQASTSHLLQYLQVAHSRNKGQEALILDTIPALIHLLLIQNEDKDDGMSLELVRGLRTLQDKRQDQGPKSSDVASVLNFIGTLLFHKEDFENALLFFQEELRLEEALAALDESISVSVTCNNIGRILQELGRSHEAIHYYQQALKSHYGDISQGSVLKGAKACSIAKTDTTDAPPATANLYSTVWYNLGLLHDKLGAYAEAISAFNMSLELRQSMLGRDHPDVACLLYNIGVLQMEQQQLKEATFSFREALRIRRVASTGQLNDHHVVKTLEKLASLHKAKGNIEGALEASREVFHIQEASLDYEPITRIKEMGVMLRSIAELHHAIGDTDAAIETATESVRKLQSVVDMYEAKGALAHFVEKSFDVEQLVNSLLLVGSIYHETAEPLLAHSIFQRAVVILKTNSAGYRNPPTTSLDALLEVTLMLATGQCAPEA
jgi:tetratricopeptide (TPR) repeat protein